jgi:glucuronokinase
MVNTDSWGSAYARVGLLGNPSDGYGGRVISMTVPIFEARVRAAPSFSWSFGGSELLEAAVEALVSRCPALVDRPAALSFETTIPRQVGLSGSSAIITAGLRALANRAGVSWDPVELARCALETETDVLGWAAGPQDRVVQSYEGLVDMDFTVGWQSDRYERLDPSRLPGLFLAWDQSVGEPSTVAHSDVRQRWLAGDKEIIGVMARFAEVAREGRSALDAGRAIERWPSLLREAFRLRSQIWSITDRDRVLVGIGETLGSGVAFAGSGGSVVGTVANAEVLGDLREQYRLAGAGFHIISGHDIGVMVPNDD